MRRIVQPPARALFRRRVEIDLHIGVWEHDRANVTAFHDDPAVLAEVALTGDEDFAHVREPRHGGRSLVDIGRANRGCYVLAVDLHHAAFYLDVRALRDVRNPRSIIKWDAILRGLPCHGAIHRPCIDVTVPKLVRDGAGDSALPGAARAIDGND
jgi:hypothetical protein